MFERTHIPRRLCLIAPRADLQRHAQIMFLHNRLARIMHPQNHHARLPTVQEQVVLSCAPIQECCTNLPMYNFLRLGA